VQFVQESRNWIGIWHCALGLILEGLAE
jgi:hypothetical protein